MSGVERRALILEKASRLFARKGLHGVTTKEIAKASGVSEPVLYQHFASKEAIYEDLQSLCKDQTKELRALLSARPPSTATLVLACYLLVMVISLKREPGDGGGPSATTDTLLRLMGFSFLEDGRFARVLLRDCLGAVLPYWTASYEAARMAGDIEGDGTDARDLWLAYELVIAAGLFRLPRPALIEDLAADDALLERATLFILRGLGLKESAIRKHFKPAELRQA